MTIKITAGKFYRIREGRVVGPAKRNTTGRNELSHPWQVGGLTYAEDGSYYKPFGTDFDIIEEVTQGPTPHPDAARIESGGTLFHVHPTHGLIAEYPNGRYELVAFDPNAEPVLVSVNRVYVARGEPQTIEFRETGNPLKW